MPAVIFLPCLIPLAAQSLLCISKTVDAQTEILLEEIAEISKSMLGSSELPQLCYFLGWLEVHSTVQYSGASSSSALGFQTFLPGKPPGTHRFQDLSGHGETTPNMLSLALTLHKKESSPGMVRERHIVSQI